MTEQKKGNHHFDQLLRSGFPGWTPATTAREGVFPRDHPMGGTAIAGP
jgi:hypothetical protein